MDPHGHRELIGHRSTEGSGIFAKPRWTEIYLWHYPDPAPGMSRFLLVIKGKSSLEGERSLTTRHPARTLKLALERLDLSKAPEASVARQAREWAKDRDHG